MFANHRRRTEFAFRILLIASILLGAPLNTFSVKAGDVQGAEVRWGVDD